MRHAAVHAGLAALLIAFSGSAFAAREFTDDAGRKVMLPDRVERVYAAGPPASVLVFAIAPDKLIGWTRGFREDEAQWIPEKYARLPELGRLTGRGNTANVDPLSRSLPSRPREGSRDVLQALLPSRAHGRAGRCVALGAGCRPALAHCGAG